MNVLLLLMALSTFLFPVFGTRVVLCHAVHEWAEKGVSTARSACLGNITHGWHRPPRNGIFLWCRCQSPSLWQKLCEGASHPTGTVARSREQHTSGRR